MDVREFCEYHNIYIDQLRAVGRNRWHPGDTTFRVVLKRPDNTTRSGERQLTVPEFTVGSAVEFPDDSDEAGEAALVDASTADNVYSAMELADDFGMDWHDEDEREQAERIYKGVKMYARKLKQFLGEGLYEDFLFRIEDY